MTPETRAACHDLVHRVCKNDALILWSGSSPEAEKQALALAQMLGERCKKLKVVHVRLEAVTKEAVKKAVEKIKAKCIISDGFGFSSDLVAAAELKEETEMRVGAAFARFNSMVLGPEVKELG